MRKDMTSKLLMAGLVAGIGAGTASAGSFTSSVLDAATDAGTLNVPSISYTFNDVSGADYYDNDSDGFVSTGDVILGTFVLDSVATTAGATGSANQNNVSGAYAIQVDTVAPTGGGTASVSFTSVSGSGQDTLVNDVLGGFDAAIFEGGTPTNSTLNPTPGAFAVGSAWTDGDLQAGLGLSTYSLFFNGTDLSTLASLTDNAQLATITNGIFTVVDDGSSDGGDGIGDVFANIIGTPVQVTGAVRSAGDVSAGGTSDFYFKDDATFSLEGTVIPSPSAAVFGLLGLGALSARRRRKA